MPYGNNLGFNGHVRNYRESPLENRVFLDSYVRFTCWLRLVTAFEQIVLLENPKLETTRRLSAVAAFHHQVGLQREDLACMAIGCLAHGKDQALRIPDILSRVSFSSDPVKAQAYLRQQIALLGSGTKKVRINAQSFFTDMVNFKGTELIELMGIKWRYVPSVKTARGRRLELWRQLPENIHFLASHLAEECGPLMSSMFNKIKHGPQVVIADMNEYRKSLLEIYSAETVTDLLSQWDGTHEAVRVLFKGSHLADTEDSNDLPTIFLEHRLAAMKKLLFNAIFPATQGLWILVNFLRMQLYEDPWVEQSPIVGEMEALHLEFDIHS